MINHLTFEIDLFSAAQFLLNFLSGLISGCFSPTLADGDSTIFFGDCLVSSKVVGGSCFGAN